MQSCSDMIRWLWLAPLVLLAPRAADADNACRVVDVSFTPTDGLQMVGWVEKPDGTFVDTIYITQKTGRYGLGNRPGRFDFNSGPPPSAGHDDMWPYGRRITTFPVWAHRHGKTFPQVVFQNGDENNLSHPYGESSRENTPPYCRPTQPGEKAWDTSTCATQPFTDKGVFSMTQTSLYPPRSDIAQSASDSPSVAMYKLMNPWDAISQATPPGGSCAQITWPIPTSLPLGDYVMFLEVSKEFDFNTAYNCTPNSSTGAWDCTYPPPCGGTQVAPNCTMPEIPWFEYGQPYRGQPSVVYQVPFTIGSTETAATAQSYVGYGDPTGADGTLRPPDATISTDTPGSGGARLMLIAGSADRLRVSTHPETDAIAPAAPAALATMALDAGGATVQFIAPGDDGQIGAVSGYDIRVRANDEMTSDNFTTSMPVSSTVSPGTGASCGVEGGYPPAGTVENVQISGLLPETDYWVGIRAFDKCHNPGELAILKFTTPDRQAGEVSACFVATAAYGTAMANDVELLRHFRDTMLDSTALGELAVETYYTFGPPVAGVVGESDVLRAAARDLLAPMVRRIRGLVF